MYRACKVIKITTSFCRSYMLSLRMLSHGFKIITLDTFSWKYNNLRTNVSLSLSFNLPSVLEYDSIRYFHAISFECSSIRSHEHTLRSKVHCDLVLVLSPSILALGPWPWHWPSPCTQPYNFAHILLQNIAQEVFFTTLHTSYCKHWTRS